MPDAKITELAADASPALTDLLVTVEDPSGTPVTKKITIQALLDLLKASQSDQETGTSVDKLVTPGVQHNHPSSAKFWVQWTANSTTILSSYNVASIADTTVGDADITIATDFSSADWAGFVSTQDSTANGWDANSIQSSGFNAKAAGTCGVLCGMMVDGGTAVGNLIDPQQWQVVGFGDQ